MTYDPDGYEKRYRSVYLAESHLRTHADLMDFEDPSGIDHEILNDLRIQLIAKNTEITVTAVNTILLEFKTAYDFVLYTIRKYGTQADRVGIYLNETLIDVMSHGANMRPEFNVPIFVHAGDVIKIVNMSATTGVHGVFVWGKRVTAVELYDLVVGHYSRALRLMRDFSVMDPETYNAHQKLSKHGKLR